MFHATTLIQQAIDTNGVTIDELTEIVLNVDKSRRWHYYFVDHRNRLLFWVHPIKPRDDLNIDLQEITGYSHISTFDVPLFSLTDAFRIFGRGPVLVCFFRQPFKYVCTRCVLFNTDPISSILYMTWNRGPIANTTRTTVPFQKVSSSVLEGCSIMLRPVHPFFQILRLFL